MARATIGALLLLVMAQSQAPRDGGLLADAAIVIAGQGLDYWSTEYKIARGHAERSGPAYRGGPVGRAALKVALVSGVIVGCHELRKHGRSRDARLLAVLAGVIGAGMAAHNLAQR